MPNYMAMGSRISCCCPSSATKSCLPAVQDNPVGGTCARLTMARGAFSKFLGRSAFRFNLFSKTALSHIKTNSKPFSMTNTAISAA
jgi:hypothetical protein